MFHSSTKHATSRERETVWMDVGLITERFYSFNILFYSGSIDAKGNNVTVIVRYNPPGGFIFKIGPVSS